MKTDKAMHMLAVMASTMAILAAANIMDLRGYTRASEYLLTAFLLAGPGAAVVGLFTRSTKRCRRFFVTAHLLLGLGVVVAIGKFFIPPNSLSRIFYDYDRYEQVLRPAGGSLDPPGKEEAPR